MNKKIREMSKVKLAVKMQESDDVDRSMCVKSLNDMKDKLIMYVNISCDKSKYN